MGFPADVWGVYDTPEREVGEGPGGKKLRQSVSAWVQHSRVLFIANKLPVGEEQAEVAAFSNNKEAAGYAEQFCLWLCLVQNTAARVATRLQCQLGPAASCPGAKPQLANYICLNP